MNVVLYVAPFYAINQANFPPHVAMMFAITKQDKLRVWSSKETLHPGSGKLAFAYDDAQYVCGGSDIVCLAVATMFHPHHHRPLIFNVSCGGKDRSCLSE